MHVGRRFRFGQGAEQAAGGQAIGEAGRKREHELGGPHQQQRQVGRAGGREVEQQPKRLEGRGIADQVGLVDDQQGTAARRGRGRELIAKLANG